MTETMNPPEYKLLRIARGFEHLRFAFPSQIRMTPPGIYIWPCVTRLFLMGRPLGTTRRFQDCDCCQNQLVLFSRTTMFFLLGLRMGYTEPGLMAFHLHHQYPPPMLLDHVLYATKLTIGS